MELVLLASPLVLAFWAGILINWRWGVYGLVAYTPFTGLIVALLYPSPLGPLVRDVGVVLPLYLAFFLMGRQAHYGRVPGVLYVTYALLVLVVLFAAANPAVPNMMVAGIGVKVWLSYIPLLIVGASFVRTELDLRDFLRAVLVTAWIPWTVGIFLFLCASFADYETYARMIFGAYAPLATSDFGSFSGYGAKLYRIPGTFQYNSQYGVFCYFMLFPMFMLLAIERDRTWRAFIWLSMFVGLVAGFTSGARGNFLFMPLIFLIVQFFKFRAGGLVQGIIGIGGGLILAFSLSGFDSSKIYGEVGNLTASYGKDLAVGGMLEAMERGGIFGRGVGANTGAARHGFDPSTAALLTAEGGMVENYYAKSMVELGAVGFIILVACLVLAVFACLRVQFRLKPGPLRDVAACGTAMTAFVVLVSVKGWALDTEPLNYYYYLTVGFVFALPYVERRSMAAVSGQTARPVPADMRDVDAPIPAAPTVPGRPATAGGRPHRPLIGRNGYYGEIARRRPLSPPPAPADERPLRLPERGDPKDVPH
ncbi:hypothetical protein [Reyranella sp. CPCC 100927]|uniref:hypothetical protein n=1 Tax=Reyranella sp. CPCC 100927 TaxID=2599616 RepID=UPI0011B779C8|nr:hypothetical protein [Reyranella sp. CPCC 100927]TWT05752.1 hypothetical protein FQU96_24945 [Reyranella sp. CPCC 100927]